MIIDLETLDLSNIRNPLIRTILICLFTDAYVSDDELLGNISNQGWWGNEIEVLVGNIKEKINWGSKLWILKRAKMNEISESLVETMVFESLDIIIRGKIIKSLEVNVTKKDNRINIIIIVDGEILEIRGF